MSNLPPTSMGSGGSSGGGIPHTQATELHPLPLPLHHPHNQLQPRTTAESAAAASSATATDASALATGPIPDLTYWDNDDVETLRDLLAHGERAKWKYISTELTRQRNKRIPAVACQKKFKDMFGAAEASSLLGSSLCYVVAEDGWACIENNYKESENESFSASAGPSRQATAPESSETLARPGMYEYTTASSSSSLANAAYQPQQHQNLPPPQFPGLGPAASSSASGYSSGSANRKLPGAAFPRPDDQGHRPENS